LAGFLHGFLEDTLPCFLLRNNSIGKQIVIDVETGDYEIDSDGLAASRRLLAKHPDAALFGARIGYDAVYALGGALMPTKQ
jgi:hypothetical protein